MTLDLAQQVPLALGSPGAAELHSWMGSTVARLLHQKSPDMFHGVKIWAKWSPEHRLDVLVVKVDLCAECAGVLLC